MRIADIVEVKFPVLVSLVGQILWLTGNGIYLTARGAYFLDNAGVYVAPQLGATGRSPKSAVK